MSGAGAAAQPAQTLQSLPACSAALWPCPQIVSRYDIVLIQEVRDSHLVAVGKLLDHLNQWVKWGPRRPGGRGTMTTVSSQARCQVSPTVGTQVWGTLGLAPPPTPDWNVCLLNPGMTQTTTTTWSVSHWAATATRSATSFCSGNTAGLHLTGTREAAMWPTVRVPLPSGFGARTRAPRAGV